MDQTRFVIDANGSLGQTFLEWSIHWLSGQTTYFSWKKLRSIDLVKSPLKEVNAHNHEKNHPCGFLETKKCSEAIMNQSQNNLVSCIPFDLSTDSGAEYLKLENFINNDRQKRLNFLHNSNFKLIHLFLPSRLSIYADLPVRNLSVKTLNSKNELVVKTYSTPEKLVEDYLNKYFNKSIEKYENIKVWDFRELLALNLNHKKDEEYKHYKENLLLSLPHKFIFVEDLWCNGEETILDTMSFLNLSINEERLSTWRPIYYRWQKIQLKRLSFIYNLDHIVEAIVKNYDCDLSRFNLTIIHEAIIQSKLIKDYNLTIKNFELEKFPNNTQDIHKLLEDNFHTIL